jgi:hypothetical protein
MLVRIRPLLVMLIVLLAIPLAAWAQVAVTVDRNTGAKATHDFKFERVPSPATDDAGAKAKRIIADGEMDQNAGSVGALTDGLLPRDEDEPGSNFFFDAGTPGGRFVLDLGGVIDIGQINSYSWHPNTRGPQVYTLYVSDGSNPKFQAAPGHGVDPIAVGWTRLTAVDTRPPVGNEGGGQYGVSIADSRGSLGRYRYLLFDCAATETFDDYGNTFYSEIDVVARKAPALQVAPRPRQQADAEAKGDGWKEMRQMPDAARPHEPVATVVQTQVVELRRREWR